MRSIPQALFWETFANGRWSLPGMFLLATLIPILVYGSLTGIGVDSQSREFIVLQFAFIPLVIFQLAIGIVVAQGPPSRLYIRPISSSVIVAWHTFSGAAILAVETAAVAWLFNCLFDVNWPILGPAAFAVAAWSSYQVLFCLANLQSATALVLSGVPALSLCCWLQSRYGPFLSPPKHNWTEFTGLEAVTLLAAFCICFALTTFAVNLARCGERIPETGILKWCGRRWDAIASQFARTRTFPSSYAAQSWFEWSTKGIILPMMVLVWGPVLGLVALGFWCFGTLNLGQSQKALLWLGGMLTLLAIPIGVLFGLNLDFESQGQRDRQLGDSASSIHFTSGNSFLFSRPYSNFDFATTILITCFKSVLLTWGSWMVVLLGSLLLMYCTGERSKEFLFPRLGWLFFPLTLLGPWVAIANTATLVLTGRGAKIFVASVFPCVGYFVAIAGLRYFANDNTVAILHGTVVSAISLGLVGGSVCAYAAAQKRGYLTSRGCMLAATVFTVASVVGVALLPSGIWWGDVPVIPATMSLVVLPFAAMPLAISWNRHR